MAEKQDIPVQIVLRPYASSIPLAALAFATGNLLYSALLLHWIPDAEARTVGLMLLAFVGPLEIVPSLMAFLARDSGGATAFAIFGASWLVQGLELLGGSASAKSAADAMFLMALAVCLALLASVTFRGKPLLGVTLAVAIVRTVLAAAGQVSTAAWLSPATAITGLVLAALAFYIGLAFLQEDVTQKISPLTFRTGDARAAMEGPLEEQIAALHREAGVRKQL